MYMMNKKFTAFYLLCLSGLSLTISACGGGSSDDTAGSASTDTSAVTQNLQPRVVYNVGSLVNANTIAHYNPFCLFRDESSAVLINGDGQGTGISLDFASGKVSEVTGLPKLDTVNQHDRCLISGGQLAWTNDAKPTDLNIYDPKSKQTHTVDVSQTNIAGADISGASFYWNQATDILYANKTFMDDHIIGMAAITPGETSANNSVIYAWDGGVNSMSVFYGFNSFDGGFSQLYPADLTTGEPASLVTINPRVDINESDSQTVQYITNSDGEAIQAMMSSHDFVRYGTNLIMSTGLLGLNLYKCTVDAEQANNFICGSGSYSVNQKYMPMRLLGGSGNTIYYLGSDLVDGNIALLATNLS